MSMFSGIGKALGMGKKQLPKPNVTPMAPQGMAGRPRAPGAPTAPQAGGNTLADQYKFYASDLDNQKNQALADTRSSAARRGVYYGTPLTGSEADINTQYLRGMGQLQAGMYQNAQQDQLTRLGMASNLLGPAGSSMPGGGGIDPRTMSAIGAMFGGGGNGVARPRVGPRLGVNDKPNDKSIKAPGGK